MPTGGVPAEPGSGAIAPDNRPEVPQPIPTEGPIKERSQLRGSCFGLLRSGPAHVGGCGQQVPSLTVTFRIESRRITSM